MPISESTIKEIQSALKEEYGQDLDFKETIEFTQSWVNYFDWLIEAESEQGNNQLN